MSEQVVFEARYDGGRCGLCDEPLVEGDRLTYVEDELCHARCRWRRLREGLSYPDDDAFGGASEQEAPPVDGGNGG